MKKQGFTYEAKESIGLSGRKALCKSVRPESLYFDGVQSDQPSMEPHFQRLGDMIARLV